MSRLHSGNPFSPIFIVTITFCIVIKYLSVLILIILIIKLSGDGTSVDKVLAASKGFFSDYKDTITGIASFAAVMLLGITIYQIKATRNQILGNLNFQIIKESNNITAKFSEDLEVYYYRYSKVLDYNLQLRAKPLIAMQMNFQACLFELNSLGLIENKIWSQIDSEIKAQLDYPPYKVFWREKILNTPWYPDGFKNYYKQKYPMEKEETP